MSDETAAPPDPDTEVLETIEFVKGFLRVGRLSWEDWKNMDSATRAYFIEASEQLEAERATLTAVASGDPLGPARVYARVDEGDTLVHGALGLALARAVERK